MRSAMYISSLDNSKHNSWFFKAKFIEMILYLLTYNIGFWCLHLYCIWWYFVRSNVYTSDFLKEMYYVMLLQ